MDTYGFAHDAERRKRWELLLRRLERLATEYHRDAGGRAGLSFAAMAGIIGTLCTIARLHGHGVTSILAFTPPSDERGKDGRLCLTLIGGNLLGR
jgi:hypothetical protein